MVEKIRIKLARWIAKKHIESIENSVNQRVAEVISKMDPFEPFFKRFGGVFSKEHLRPEQNLDARSTLMLITWGYQQRDDPSFKYMYDWIMNNQGQDAIKKGNPTPETILYSRALMVIMPLLKREIERLASIYEDKLRDKDSEFDTTITVE
mgnify:CR=1 FL=1